MGPQVTLDTPTHSPTPLPPWHCEPAALVPISSYYWTVALDVPTQRLSITKRGKMSWGNGALPVPKNFYIIVQVPSHIDEVTHKHEVAKFHVAEWLLKGLNGS